MGGHVGGIRVDPLIVVGRFIFLGGGSGGVCFASAASESVLFFFFLKLYFVL